MSTQPTAISRLRSALGDGPAPAALVDLAAFDANAATVAGLLGDSKITVRLATKSVRVPTLLRRALDAHPSRFVGLMTFCAAETATLAELGFDDLLLGYPLASRSEADTIARVAASGRLVRVVVDDAAQLGLLGAAAAAQRTTIAVCVDVDMSTRLPTMPHVGVRRSPLQTAEQAVALAQRIAATPGLRLDSLLGYEAQIAGLADHNPLNSPALDPVRRLIKRRAIPAVAQRRREVLAALAAAGYPIRLVNGGGSGSLLSTQRDPSVSEITVGSALYDSHLFDGYDGIALQPALFFALRVVRRPAERIVTCAGGGFVASGPPGADRLPIAVDPPGLRPLPMEAWGEVQTPFAVPNGAAVPAIGDVVLCRAAKAGEPLERFAEVALVRSDGSVERVPTYRGLGSRFT